MSMKEDGIIRDPNITLDQYEVLLSAAKQTVIADRALDDLLMLGQENLAVGGRECITLREASSILREMVGSTRNRAEEYRRKIIIQEMTEGVGTLWLNKK